jgi:hypothetical protein
VSRNPLDNPSSERVESKDVLLDEVKREETKIADEAKRPVEVDNGGPKKPVMEEESGLTLNETAVSSKESAAHDEIDKSNLIMSSKIVIALRSQRLRSAP